LAGTAALSAPNASTVKAMQVADKCKGKHIASAGALFKKLDSDLPDAWAIRRAAWVAAGVLSRHVLA
jgi:hypothetical protein